MTYFNYHIIHFYTYIIKYWKHKNGFKTDNKSDISS